MAQGIQGMARSVVVAAAAAVDDEIAKCPEKPGPGRERRRIQGGKKGI
jgi:hypothetical protein